MKGLSLYSKMTSIQVWEQYKQENLIFPSKNILTENFNMKYFSKRSEQEGRTSSGGS